ncbi:MAG: stage II sporulation protein D [Bacilli bacterium]|nr:stage II sporulation protein D [Bacilli bacterium]
MDLETYIIGVVAGEMPALFEKEALKAQAIAARSYVLSKRINTNQSLKITSTINDQVFLTTEELKEKWSNNYFSYYNKVKDCVKSTSNLVLKQNGKIVRSYYFSMSNGYTQDSELVFGEKNFTSVESKWESEKIKNFLVSTKIKKEDFLAKLDLSNKNFIINNINRTKTNHVDIIEINNVKFNGIEFRKIFNLRSTDFTIKESENDIIIRTKGYGHGVGMSQYGANEMAKLGYNYKEILTHYYNNTEIANI